MRIRFLAIWGILTVLVTGGLCLAERIVLKDGTELEGTVIPQGDNYWIKTTDGTTRTIPKSQVASIGGSSPTGSRGIPTPPPPGETAAGGATFRQTKLKADRVEAPLAAVTLWQAFVDQNPDSPDIEAARQELETWKKLADDGAEKIRGKWVGGEERQAIIDRADRLTKEGLELLGRDATLQAIKKFEEANQVYPNSFQIAFLLGFVAMGQNNPDSAIRYFEQALRIKEDSPEALSNLGVAYIHKKQVEKGIGYIHKAAQIEDNKAIATNLIGAVWANPSIARSSRHRQTMDTVNLLAMKYGLPRDRPPPAFLLIPLRPDTLEAGPGDIVAGMSSGTGFLVNEEGIIVTNAHVVDGGKTLMVVLGQSDRRSAELVAMDKDQDLAIIRIKPKPDEKLPYLRFMASDKPSDGAECTVMGYPMADRLGMAIKVTRGIVSSAASSGAADVLIDAKVNPGNSGGPILDKYGNVMAVVCMKSLSSTTEESYGIGISTGNARRFLQKHNITIHTADAGGTPLSTEEIAAKVKPATVCILATH